MEQQQSTEIRNLQNNEEEDPRIVQSILQEMNEEDNKNSPQMQQACPREPMQQYNQELYDYENDEDMEEEYEQPVKLSIYETIMKEIREPVLIILLYVSLNIPIVDQYLTRYIPQISSESGSLNTIGTVLKSLLLALVFYVVTKLIKM